MLPEEDLIITQGRAGHGGNFVSLQHTPSGISRHHPGPLAGVNVHRLLREWSEQIEAELLVRGLTQYSVPDCRTKSNWQSGTR